MKTGGASEMRPRLADHVHVSSGRKESNKDQILIMSFLRANQEFVSQINKVIASVIVVLCFWLLFSGILNLGFLNIGLVIPVIVLIIGWGIANANLIAKCRAAVDLSINQNQF